MSKQSQITLDVTVDENHVPESMSWSAPDGGIEKAEADAFMLSVWDAKAKDTLRIDLWTKGMQVEDMKRFYHQTLLAMADGLERSTDEKKMAEDLRDYAAHFADKLSLFSSDEDQSPR
ncbi:MAG: gliding motility protein GldC [Flavobacteriales bacterium]|jgi:gliding motility-associated protein GldC|uniref:Probable gliding motitilty protein n=1 Tax=uncultured marine bacterium Ant29B7 TaxID=360426 RepID=Q2PY77_9BACT|nr:probable gliding motitilty protein [uncultured marine bacterium Ant29B7]MDE0791397.1 gliding motility protein GldC [Schleiferiaceae bacterium]|tara:strand:+ start:5829 stop:6182 length:354 start_codon:yes stop_codon:yes gene_type:complete